MALFPYPQVPANFLPEPLSLNAKPPTSVSSPPQPGFCFHVPVTVSPVTLPRTTPSQKVYQPQIVELPFRWIR